MKKEYICYKLSDASKEACKIDNELFPMYNVKRGLRNEDTYGEGGVHDKINSHEKWFIKEHRKISHTLEYTPAPRKIMGQTGTCHNRQGLYGERLHRKIPAASSHAPVGLFRSNRQYWLAILHLSNKRTLRADPTSDRARVQLVQLLPHHPSTHR